jgi:hypothetical protein
VEGTASSGCGTSSRSRDPLERVNLKERHKDVYERLVAERQAWNASMLPEIAESFINFRGTCRPLRRAETQVGRPIPSSLWLRQRSCGDCPILLIPVTKEGRLTALPRRSSVLRRRTAVHPFRPFAALVARTASGRDGLKPPPTLPVNLYNHKRHVLPACAPRRNLSDAVSNRPESR